MSKSCKFLEKVVNYLQKLKVKILYLVYKI